MSTGTSKNQRRAAAREQARIARERAESRRRLVRWLVPSGVTVAVLAVIAIVVLVVVNSGPAAQTAAGPENMRSDGILFTGKDGAVVATRTAAIPASGTPTPTKTDAGDGVAHIVSYIDLQCPFCRQFEATNADAIQKQVAAGTATLEVHPIAILDRSSEGTRYASRAANAMAAVAQYAPDRFLTVLAALYAQQPAENTSGLSDARILSIIHDAGVRDASVDAAVRGETFRSWVTSSTARAAGDSSLYQPGQSGIATPTVLVNGHMYAGAVDDASAFAAFVAQSR